MTKTKRVSNCCEAPVESTPYYFYACTKCKKPCKVIEKEVEVIIGIKIVFKDGTEDCYDPCEEILIDNGAFDYHIQVDTIKSISTYEVEENERKRT